MQTLTTELCVIFKHCCPKNADIIKTGLFFWGFKFKLERFHSIALSIEGSCERTELPLEKGGPLVHCNEQDGQN